MEFDNTAFEHKIAATIESLGRLEKSLQLTGAKKGLEDVSEAAGKFNMGNMGTALEDVSRKFLALSAVAITVIANITTAAVKAGAQLVKEFSVQPILDGFREWETNMNSIQTILANTDSKGTTLEQVNAALDQLNEYSDKTIYNFAQMARNIGTFTAAGVDLDTSVNSIKGIANLAAISGSSAEQASTAMYQLSQAIATGSVKLMDWNSVVNAGMGGEVFQKALFETGKALGTISNVPMKQTFEEWKDGGNSFRASLESGWVTAEVLTNTLQSFTGDLTIAQLTALGYTEQQAVEMQRLGKLGQAAATEVKTLTQLLGTVKESVASGWSQSFRIVFGTFDEAKQLFTGINNVIGKFVGDNADARNSLLQSWKDMGGRLILIHGIQSAFKGLMSILEPIKQAFRNIFPPMTAQRLLELTEAFTEFAKKIDISGETALKIKSIFRGVFAAFEIGFTVVKEFIKLVADLVGELIGSGGGIADFAAGVGDFLYRLNAALVAGGGIHDFFQRLRDVIKDPLPFLQELRDKFVDFFENHDFGSLQGIIDMLKSFGDAIAGLFGAAGEPAAAGIESLADRLGERFGMLVTIFQKVRDAIGWTIDKFKAISGVLEEVFQAIADWFKELGNKLAAVIGPGDFDAVMDALNLSLLGGIALLLKKFFDNGLKIDFGGGLMDSIKKTFETLTGTMEAMQTKIKADALMKIAIAIGILTASVVVLSLIDSAALTKALTAMAVGFGQLVATMVALGKLGGTGANFAVMAGGLILLATAILILSAAMAIMGQLSWEEIAKGLVTVAGLLIVLAGAVKLMSGNTGGMIRAGLGIMAIAIALNILAGAMKIFATMSWAEMGQGLVGVAGALIIIAGAMRLMPKNMVLTGAGLIAVGIGLTILAGALKIFATMSWEEMGKGAVALAGALLLIAGAMQLMPASLPVTAAGLVLVAFAMNILAGALLLMASMSWTEIGKGLATLAGALILIALATNAMSGAIVGAIAMVIVAGALTVLVGVLKTIAKMKTSDIVKGLLGIAGVIVVLAGAALLISPIIGPLLLLGAALLIIGAGLALFGSGAYLTARAFQVLAEAGSAGIGVLLELIDALLTRLPAIAKAFAMAFVDMALTFLEAAPVLIDALTVLIGHILETIIELAPKIGEAFKALILTAIDVIRALFPDLVQLGWDMLVALLKGIEDHIGQIVEAAIGILTNFLNGIADNISKVTEAAVNVLTAFIEAMSQGYILLIEAGFKLLLDFLQGIADNIGEVITAAGDIVTEFIKGLDQVAQDIIDAGGDLIINLIEGFGTKVNEVIDAGVDTVLSFIEGLGQNAIELARGAAQVLVDFLNGLADAIEFYMPQIRDAGWRVVEAIIDGMLGGFGDLAQKVYDKAKEIADNIIDKLKHPWEIFSPSRVTREMGQMLMLGLAIGIEKEGEKTLEKTEEVSADIFDAMRKTLSQVQLGLDDSIDFNPVITPVLDLSGVQTKAKQLDAMIASLVPMSVDMGLGQAQIISTERARQAQEAAEEVTTPQQPGEIRFEQTINAPTELSTGDIYRQTKNLVVLAKEELKIS
jgi:tape measure domain-containing protein